jgi:hypothetical protein
MKKNLPIIILVVVVVGILGVGGWYFLSKGEVPGMSSEGGQGILTPQEEGQSFTGKLKDALTLGQSMKCTWSQDADNFGTAYVKNEKIRSDITTDGKAAHTIVADNCTWFWEEGSTEGMKICYEPTEMEEMEEVETAEMEGIEEIPEEYSYQEPDIDYTCQPAVVSDSMFSPPSGVNFINPQEMMGQ